MKNLLSLLFLLFAGLLPAQNFFQNCAETDIHLSDEATRKLIPAQYNTCRLDVQALAQFLAEAPMEFTAEAHAMNHVIEIPQADGSMEQFAVWKVMALEPLIYERHPEVRTFAGVSIRNPGKTIRGSITVLGCRIMTMLPDFNVCYLEPFASKQTEYYMVYDRRDIPQTPDILVPGSWEPTELEMPLDKSRLSSDPVLDRSPNVDPVHLKVFRYAVSCTGQFAEDQGNGTQDDAFAAVIEYSNMVSAIFERDIDLRLQLIAASEAVIYTNAATDPFTGTDVSSWMAQNPSVLNQWIGETHYDVGHVYARYLGGSAIGVAGGISCTSSKGRGCSAGTGSYGDRFISVIGQEVGHQMSGGHTWNRCGGGGGRAGITAFEPGSGTTIMSYAGACGSDNVQNYTDLYYHSGSIQEIRNFYTFGAGTCANDVLTTNTHPVVTIDYQDNFFIPILTPFELNGSATDPDGDDLSFHWEEIDVGEECPLEAPVGNAPLFRTWPAGANTNRYFPRLTTIISNGFDLNEQLPTFTRDMTFRFAARDNKPGGGGVSWADVAFKATADAGPFLVSYPNSSNVNLAIGSYVNINWDVANTNELPVNCQLVNIRLSTDGGQTYPTMLAENVVNDGKQLILVPNLPSSAARIRVEAADNIFFDISNANFKIVQAASPGLSIGLTNDGGRFCLPNVFQSEILSAGLLGYNQAISVDLLGNLPPGASAEFSANNFLPGSSCSLSVDLNQVFTAGQFSFTVQAISGGDTLLFPINLNLIRNDFSQMALLSPVDGITGVSQSQPMVLRWNKADDALSYDLQFASSPTFAPGTIIASKTGTAVDTFRVPGALQTNKIYYWRVRPVNTCGTHEWLDAYAFATGVENCNVWTANDLPKPISASGTPTIESKISVNGGGPILDMNVKTIAGYHGFFKDLDVKLISPQGTEVVLFSEKCGNYSGLFNFGLDDEALSAFACPPPNSGVVMRPVNPLSAFDGELPVGIWTLRVKDLVSSSGGGLEGFQLEFCSPADLNPPYLVNNDPLLVSPGANALLSTGLLLAQDADNTAAQITYTLVTTPKHGRLQKTGYGELFVGDTFTQAEIDNGTIRYYNYSIDAEGDYFRFTLTDNANGFFGTPKFVIQSADPLSAHSSDLAAPGFKVYPNPSTGAVWLQLDQALNAESSIYVINTAGQVLHESALAGGATQQLLNLEQLPRGLYFVQIRSNNGVSTRRLMLQGR